MSNIDLVLINPAAAHGILGNHPIYGDLGNELVAIEQPLWCRLIAGYVRDRGYTVQIIDAEALKLSPDMVAHDIARLRPRLVAIAVYGHMPSASTQQMVGASETAKQIKQRWPESKIIMLGGHVSALPEQTMREEQIDFACVGEGPTTITALLGNDPLNAPGLVWRSGCKININKSAPLIEDLSQLHGNTWDLLPMRIYKAHNWQCFDDLKSRYPYASIYTSLGCPYSCSFCCINAPFESHRYRMRKPYDVVCEIIALHISYGVSTFKIIDEMFVLNEKHYMAIAQGLIDSGHAYKLNIWAYARVDTVRPHVLQTLRRAGIRWLALGIESGSKYVRDGASKRLKNDDIKTVVRTIQAADINVIGNYIFGLPDDDMDSMRETLNLALDLNTEFANMYVAQAYPGSPLYDEALKQGWELPETWAGYSQHNDLCRPLDTRHIRAADVLKFRDEAFQVYFRNPCYLEMIERKFGAETVEHIRQMVKYKLPRRLLRDTFAPEEKVSAH